MKGSVVGHLDARPDLRPALGDAARVGDQQHLAAARHHLLHIGDGLLEQRVMRRDDDDRHVLVDQRDGAVLHLARGIAFGMDVGDFLELQRAFERQRDSSARGRDRARRAPWRSPRPSASSFGFLLEEFGDMARGFEQRGAEPLLLAARRACRARAPAAMASEASAANWQVKALVEATPISGPAKVGSTISASRAIELSATLTMAMRGLAAAPWRRAAPPACRRSRPTAKRTAPRRPWDRPDRDSAVPTPRRSPPAGAPASRTSICRPCPRNRRCRRPKWSAAMRLANASRQLRP